MSPGLVHATDYGKSSSSAAIAAEIKKSRWWWKIGCLSLSLSQFFPGKQLTFSDCWITTVTSSISLTCSLSLSLCQKGSKSALLRMSTKYSGKFLFPWVSPFYITSNVSCITGRGRGSSGGRASSKRCNHRDLGMHIERECCGWRFDRQLCTSPKWE